MKNIVKLSFALSAFLALETSLASAQSPAAITLTLEDALKRAKQYGGQIQSANLAALQASEDRLQARAAALPSVNAFNQFIYTEGNGTPSGVFVANDGVHIYNEQAVVHEEVLAYARKGEIRRAMSAEAVARAKVDVAVRGLNATVIQNYYAIVSAGRKLANAQASITQAQNFLDIAQKQEKGGEAAHADVVKAQIDLRQRQRDIQEARLTVEKTKITLGVLVFPDFNSDFAVVDDLQQIPMLPPKEEAVKQASGSSPDLNAARLSIDQSGWDVRVARYGYLPSLGLDFFYGINSNQFLARTGNPELPNGYRQNLGYAAQATLNIPVWNWGATKSKIKQAELRRDQAQLDLTLAQRSVQATLATAYAEAQLALAQIDSLRGSADLAAESLRLTLLRYQAGEAVALEVVDAQNTLNAARNAYDDGLARYRVAQATLQLLTGNL